MSAAGGMRGGLPGAGPVAVVTGASAGLGRAVSVELARRGCRVVGLARRADALAATAALCPGGRFLGIATDVADPRAVRRAFARTAAEVGSVGILVANAAVYPRHDLLTDPRAPVLGVLATNLGGQLNCALEALAQMVPLGRGRILLIGSFAGDAPVPGSLGYSVSKGAGRVLTQALAAETGGRLPGIVVSEWMPPILATGIGRHDGMDPARAAIWCARLAMNRDPALHGAVFVGAVEQRPPRALRQRFRDMLALHRRPPLHRLDGEEPAR